MPDILDCFFSALVYSKLEHKKAQKFHFQVKEPDHVCLSYTRLDEVGKTASCSLLRAAVALTQVAK